MNVRNIFQGIESSLSTVNMNVNWDNRKSSSVCSIFELFEAQVERTPDAIALVFEDNHVTYNQLNASSNQMAWHLRKNGTGQENRVALCLPRSIDAVIGLLGILKTGASYVPMDPESPGNRKAFILQETQIQCLLTREAELDQFQDISSKVVCLDRDREELEKQSIENLAVHLTAGNLAYIMYTSGSTGRPKGVLGHHQGVLNYYQYLHEAYDVGSGDVVLQIAPLTFDASLRDLVSPLTVGAKVVLLDQKQGQDPVIMLCKIREHRVTCLLSLSPSRLNSLVEARLEHEAHADSVRLVLLSGEALYRSLAQRTQFLFGNHVSLVNQYGPTECTMTSTYCLITEQVSEQEVISIGSPITQYQVYLLDPDLNPTSSQAGGEIYLSGPGLTWGYLGYPDMTANQFRPNHLHGAPGSRMYKTGDLAKYEADGCLYFHGRVDRQVKINGVRIELGEIESVLMRCHAIAKCAVIARDAKRNLVAYEGGSAGSDSAHHQMRLIAYMMCREEISHSELRNFIKTYLPSYMIPHEYIQLDRLPLNPNGKVDIKALPEPESVRPQLNQPFVSPRNDMEARVAEIIREVLGFDRVGIHDDFFELGGDSLLAMQTVNRLRRNMKVGLSVRDFFDSRTAANLVACIEQIEPRETPSIPSTEERTVHDRYPLSVAEQGIWFLWKLTPDNPYYIARGIIKLQGELDLKIFRDAWIALLERHDMMRVRFGEQDGSPFQTFHDQLNFELPVTDLSHLSGKEGYSAIQLKAEEEARRPFNLTQESPLRPRLFRMSAQEHALLLVMHEIIIDIWSIRVLLRDLLGLYKGFLQGKSAPLTPLKLNFSDYIQWEQQHITPDRLTNQEAYWKNELSGELPVLNLPFDRPRRQSPNYRNQSRCVLLDAGLSRDIKSLARKERVTLFVTLLTAFDLLLHAYCGQDDLIVGAPFANRNREEAEEITGFCLNMLPLRIDLSGDLPFTALLGRVNRKVTGAITNADYPFMWMLNFSKIPRDPQVTPIFQVMFNMLNYSDLHFKDAGLEIGYTVLQTAAPKYDLSLYAQESEGQIYLQFSYSPNLFDHVTVDRMLGAYTVLLRKIVEHPEWPVAKLDVMSEREQQMVLREWNQTHQDFTSNSCLHELFEEQAGITPDRVALIYEEQHISYAELNARANQLAHFLRRHGIGPEMPVALCLNRSIEMMVAILGTLKSGGAYVALDPEYPLLRLNDILNDTNPKILILEKTLDRFTGYSGKKVFLHEDRHWITGEDSTDLPCLTTTDNLLHIVYTSASTGKPKGTFITIGSALNRIFWMWNAHPFRPEDVAVLQKSYALVASTWECFGGLLAGIPTVILAYWDVLDRQILWKKLTENNVSYFLASPTLLEGILEQGKAKPDGWKTLRLATSGAEPMHATTALKWGETFPHVPLYNLYGSTECSSNVTAYHTQSFLSESVRVPIGRPLPNIQVYVLDRNLRVVPIGVVGELCVSGFCLARGYANFPLLTADRFIPHPYSNLPGDRLFSTGDLARYRSDGVLEIVGRQDHQVKLRGFRIDLADIESALGRHIQVKHCAVSVWEEDSERKQLVAYIVTDEPFAATEMRQFLQARLPDYMIPSTFIPLTALPQTPNGKVDRRSLPVPDPNRMNLLNVLVKPRSQTENQLARIWEDILCIHPVGITDNFFELGGNSLEAMRVVARIHSQLEKELPLVKVFQSPTIQELAVILDGEEVKSSSSILIAIQPYGTKTPFFCVHGAGGDVLRFLDLGKYWEVDRPFYGLQSRRIDEPGSGPLSIQEMAGEYIQAIRTIQKDGPYVLGGWSMGGLVACEMARQLDMDGQKAALLVLLDTQLPNRDYLSSQVTPTERHASGIVFSWKEISIAVEHLVQYDPTVLTMNGLVEVPGENSPARKIDESGNHGKIFPMPSRFQELLLSEACVEISSSNVREFIMAKAKTLHGDLNEKEAVQFFRYVQIYLENIWAKRHYRLCPYQGKVTYLSAAEGINRIPPDITCDWERILQQSIRIHEVPGNHYSMFREPNIEHLAERILSCLHGI